MHESIWKDFEGTEFRQGYLAAGEVRTRYIASGWDNDKLLILLHGTGGHAEAYSRNMASHGAHFKTVAIDMIGHGWSGAPVIDYEIHAYARHVLDVMDSLGKEKAHLSGESLGGWVATYLAVHHPDRVARLVLNTAAGWTFNPDVMQRIKDVSLTAVENPTTETIRSRLEFLMHDKSKVNDDLVEVRRRIYAQQNYAEVNRRLLCLQEPDIRLRNLITKEQYGSIVAPTMVLWTSHDPTATVDQGREISQMIPGAQFVVMEGCGHWPQFEDAETFNRIHLDFLRGQD